MPSYIPLLAIAGIVLVAVIFAHAGAWAEGIRDDADSDWEVTSWGEPPLRDFRTGLGKIVYDNQFRKRNRIEMRKQKKTELREKINRDRHPEV